MVSGLPIGHGDPVRFFALVSSPYAEERVCSPTDLWLPLHVGIRGVYNDYGSVEQLEESAVTSHFFEVLSQYAIEREGAIAVSRVEKGMPFEDWLEALWGVPSLRVRNPQERLGPWDWWKWAENSSIPEIREAWEEAQKAYDKFLGKTRSPEGYPVKTAMIREDVWGVMLNLVPKDGRPYFPSPFFHKSVLAPPEHDLELDQHGMATHALYLLSKAWMPGHTIGPQCPEYKHQALFTQAVAEIAAKQRGQELEEGADYE